MKNAEDEAFDELAKRQGGGFKAKQAMAADKLQEPWNEDEWRRNNWRCGHGWLRGEQCESCNAPQPPSEWAGIKAILDEYGLQAIDFVADFKAVLAQPPLPAQDPVAWMCSAFDGEPCEQTNHDECGNPIPLYTTPPQREWVGLTDDELKKIWYDMKHLIGWYSFQESALATEAKLKEKNNGT